MAGVQVKQEAGRVRKGTPTDTQTDRGALEIQRGETQETLGNLLGYSHSCYKFNGHGMNLLFKL